MNGTFKFKRFVSVMLAVVLCLAALLPIGCADTVPDSSTPESSAESTPNESTPTEPGVSGEEYTWAQSFPFDMLQTTNMNVVDSLDEAAEYANKIAPEHLEICLDEPFELYSKIKHASSVFLGKYTPEALGDYYAGPNHVLPTMGTARFASPLSVDDFVKKNSYICYSPEALEKASDDIITFAESEGLTAHAKSVGIRFGK